MTPAGSFGMFVNTLICGWVKARCRDVLQDSGQSRGQRRLIPSMQTQQGR